MKMKMFEMVYYAALSKLNEKGQFLFCRNFASSQFNIVCQQSEKAKTDNPQER